MDAFCRYRHKRTSSKTNLKFGTTRQDFCESPTKSCNVWFVKDIGGILCGVLTWILILFAFLTFSFVVGPLVFMNDSNIVAKIINTSFYCVFSLFALISHTKTMFSDPGSVPRIVETEPDQDSFLCSDRQYLVCSLCSSLKPARAHHCSVCRRCIRKMDHHCPWVNNCVGEANRKYFLLFLLYIGLMSIYSVFFVWIGLLNLASMTTLDGLVVSGKTAAILCWVLLIEGILFGVFSLWAMGIQLLAIAIDQTGIEQLKAGRLIWSSAKPIFLCRNLQQSLCHNAPFYWAFCPFDYPFFKRSDKHMVYYL